MMRAWPNGGGGGCSAKNKQKGTETDYILHTILKEGTTFLKE